MRSVGVGLLALLLVGCGTQPVAERIKEPETSSEVGLIAPIMVEADDADVTAVLGRDVVVFVLPDPFLWSASLTPDDLAVFVPGTNDGSMITNAALHPRATGTVEVTLTGPGGQRRVHQVTFIDGGTEAPSGDQDVEEPLDETGRTVAFAESLLDLSEADAFARAAAEGYVVRVASRDGVPQALTRDYLPSRVNVVIVDDQVVAYDIG